MASDSEDTLDGSRREHIQVRRKRRRLEVLPPCQRPRKKTRRNVPAATWSVECVAPIDTATPVFERPSEVLEGQPVPPVEAIPPQGVTFNEVLQLISSLQGGNKDKAHHLNNSQLNNVVPEFDPSSKAQSIDSWIHKVNECVKIYDWNEKQAIHFALQKLTGLAKKWFESLPSVVYSWDEWQTKLKKAFPNEQNYGRLLEEMLARTTRAGEHYREYFYDKLTLLYRCEIREKKAVQCIVHGILDKSVRNGAQTLNCEEPEDLLDYLNSQRPPDVSFIRKHNEVGPKQNSSASPSDETPMTCFNCREKGHSFINCPQPIVKCQKCHRVGHDSASCKLNPLHLRNDSKSSKTTVAEERKVL
ncbi:uncharacterized protein LOC133523244 [Cydia pomonella]|uniref:uncharacterized protein LOC133523244 n=1 Tax=Cydia pomonella TaxID=82600 RepID=UPI002ADE814F|nr:uncharacterized protein LOC133523244 [Cydia pomonella]